jgi:alcohol dehydrogenase (cytochrome c)
MKVHNREAWQIEILLALCGFAATAVLAQQGAPTPHPRVRRQQPSWPIVVPAADSIYSKRCALCHGASGTGATAGTILPYVRYHTDKELAQRIATAHSGALQFSAEDQRALAKDLRGMTGTNPSMATGGYLGFRGNFGATQIEPPMDVPAKPAFTPIETTLKLAGGKSMSGRLMAQTSTDATLLMSDGRFHLLSRDGDLYREKNILPKVDWLDNHGDKTGNRYSHLKQINNTNVQRLAKAWDFVIPTSARLEATPVVVDGIMYMVGWNEIYALDATSGEQLWSYSEPRHTGILGEAGSGANRGATISGDRVFMVTDHAHVLAFNRMTGAKLWDVEMGDYREGYSSTVAPLVVGDLVIAGVSCGEEGCRGLLDAYRMDTGKRAWRFYTIPARGEPASETWIGQALEHGCGTTWMTGSYDPVLDLVYWGTGNPCPDVTGDERKGDNLYTSSVVALNAKTGKLKWYYQFTPHDLNDWDSTQPMVLVDEMWEGQPRKLLLHADKNGMLYVLDRTNGKLLRGTAFASTVTWNSGFDKNGRPILTHDAVSCPSSINWTDVAYSPLTKLFYGRIMDACGVAQSGEGGLDPLGGGSRWYGEPGRQASPAAATSQRLADIRAKYPPGPFVRAIDLSTGKKVWDYNMGSGRSTGVLATAGNLLLIGGQGGIVALEAKTGQNLWHVDVGQTSCDGVCLEASAMTYLVGGKQYVALSGYGTVTAYSLSEQGANFATTPSRPSGVLSNKPVQRVELADAPGKDVTVRVCTTCHGDEMWSRFRLSRIEWDRTLQRMTARGMTLTEDEHKAVLDYLSKYLSVINVNTAAAADLVTGLGITENQANAIVGYREKNGAFKDIDDLKSINGLDAAAIDAKKNLITF